MHLAPGREVVKDEAPLQELQSKLVAASPERNEWRALAKKTGEKVKVAQTVVEL